MSADLELAKAAIATSLKLYTSHDIRVGMRSGTMDAAHLCDAIRNEIAGSQRKSRKRDELCAVVQRCGDAIEAMRKLVTP